MAPPPPSRWTHLASQFSTSLDFCSSLSPSPRHTEVILKWTGSPPPAGVPLPLIVHVGRTPDPRESVRYKRTLRAPRRRAETRSGPHGRLSSRRTRSLWRSSGSSFAQLWTLLWRVSEPTPNRAGSMSEERVSEQKSQEISLVWWSERSAANFPSLPQKHECLPTVLSHRSFWVKNQAIPVGLEVIPLRGVVLEIFLTSLQFNYLLTCH